MQLQRAMAAEAEAAREARAKVIMMMLMRLMVIWLVMRMILLMMITEAAREARAKVLIVPLMMMLTNFENPFSYSQVIAADGEQKAARALKVSLIIFTGCLLLMFFLLSLMIESAKNHPNKFRSYAQFCLY